VTLTDLIPGLRDKQPKGDPKHRVDDYIAALKADHEQQMEGLREENRALHNAKAGTDDHFMVMDQLVTNLEADNRALTEQAAIDQRHLAQQQGVIRTLREDLDEALGRRKDKKRVETAATKTQPIPVVPVPLHQSPMAATTNPAHVRHTSWGVDDTTPLKTVAPAT
jgi:hypothetical protein